MATRYSHDVFRANAADTAYGAIPGNTGNGTVSPRKEAVAVGVACGLTLKAAARQAHVPEQTAKGWSSLCPAFKTRVRQLRAEMTSQATGRLVESMASAAETLGYLSRQSESEMVRLLSARAVLELGIKMEGNATLTDLTHELEESLRRVRNHEQWAAQTSTGANGGGRLLPAPATETTVAAAPDGRDDS